MQSDYEMARIHHRQRNELPQLEEHHQHHQQQHRFMVENALTSSTFFPINPNYHHFSNQQSHSLIQPFFQYQHPHYYRSMLDHHQQQDQEIRLFEPEPNPEGKNNEGQEMSSSPFLPLSFNKLGMVAANSGGRSIQEDALIRGSEGYCTQARQTSLAVSHCWQNQEDSAIKQPFWKPLNNNIEREKNNQEDDQEMYRPPSEGIEENKCKVLFGELEAIYGDNNANVDIHGIASESVLTTTAAKDLPVTHDNVSFPPVLVDFNDSIQASGATTAMTTTTSAGIDIGSESASVGEAEAIRPGEVHKRKRAKESRTKSTSMSRFFESLVKKLTNHQEDLQKKFMETIERLDQERKEREEAWKEQELAKYQKEAAARAHERSLASSREATLISYLEKLTGQKINFQPIKKVVEEEDKSCYNFTKLNNNLWPQAEVDALIQIKTKFRKPRPKGLLLWEEISNSMASMGFQKSATKCKEKWENMHKCTIKTTKEITEEQFNS